jgi:glutamate dehydrogenase
VRLPGQAGSGICLSDLLETMFARAPREVLESATPEKLEAIVRASLTALSSFTKAPDKVSVELTKNCSGTGLVIVLADRPFIVSSTAERLSDFGIRVNVFLHPILVIDNRAVALSYIDISDFEDDVRAPLISALETALHLLEYVVKDFEPMTAAVLERARAMPEGSFESDFGEMEGAEIREFLEWLMDGSFFLLGTRCFDAVTKAPKQGSEKGLWRNGSLYSMQVLSEVVEDCVILQERKLELSLRKLRSTSIVHRPATLLHILVKVSESDVLSICGYLTSKAWAREAEDIPILRRKIAEILRVENALPNSHDYKYMVEIIDNMPTDEALCLPVPVLRSIIHLALGVFSREVTRSFTYIDSVSRRALTVVVFPPERFSAVTRAALQSVIEGALAAPPRSSEVHVDSTKRRQLRLYIGTPLPIGHRSEVQQDRLAQSLMQATLTWEEKLLDFVKTCGRSGSEPIHGVFPADYQAAVCFEEALADLDGYTRLSSEPVVVSLFHHGAPRHQSVISVFSFRPDLSISSVIPVLENIGLEVLGANSYVLDGHEKPVYLLKLASRSYNGSDLDTDSFNSFVANGVAAVLRGDAHNDILNNLLCSVSLDVRHIALLRCYCALLWQVSKVSTKRTMWEALTTAPHVALGLRQMFDLKFNPIVDLTLDERTQRAAEVEAQIQDDLRRVPDITHDRVLKALLSLVRATVRTNFFSGTDTFAMKVRSSEVELMPHPRPLFEIFVFSPRIEGTHLRSAKVARGGLRWSDRIDDYRAEVLGLMKTQKVKNVIIVPSGAKGGFIIKQLPREQDQISKAVEGGYREYISALLSLADNVVDGEPRHPSGIIAHDEHDPYFVVAADKGTATFSDIANSIAQKDFNFWLGDAFASGGSAGYDHKKYGITAKGGWECVLRHFRDTHIDPGQPFTVVGIGDMSGDVFGNGLLVSRSMKLLGAFNHKHVFVDPSPDPEISYAERERLFSLPRSQWTDYKAALISTGGGVFGRFDKEIALSPEIRQALSVPDDVPAAVDGETLIALILKAPVALLWNGGIGTYVKAKAESHSEVNDGTNDRVRVNADELRAKIVGEGGNLGFTQRARIEFSERGGRMNTDAIDNSGGVDLSDHEVNLKLLFSPLVKQHRLTVETRNALLVDISADVVEAVLQHNRDQALLLTVSQLRSQEGLEQYRHLVRDMHRMGYLDRNRDHLPDEADMDDRLAAKTGLYRPELAVCSAAVKMWIKERVRDSNLCQDENLERFLLEYFPPRVQKEFTDEVQAHPLRVDIIASEMVNSLLPATGISFVHNVTTLKGTNVPNVMKCLLAADKILGSNILRTDLRAHDTVQNSASFMRLWLEMGVALRQATSWLLSYHGSERLLEIVNLYDQPFDTLIEHADTIFTGQERVRFERRAAEFRALGASGKQATVLSMYRRILPVLEVLWAAREFKTPAPTVAVTYSQVLEELGINILFKFESILDASNKWEQELITGAFQEIRRSVSTITGQLIQKGVAGTNETRETLRRASGYDAVRGTMVDLEELAKQKRPFQVAVLPVVARQLRLFEV